MTHESSLNQATLARECLQHLGEDDSVLHRAAHVLELVAHSSVGLGEVLQDYAHQAWKQLHDVIRAAKNVGSGMQSADDLAILQNAPLVVKSVRTVLERTPVAMERNGAGSIGEKEKLARAHVVEAAHAFAHSPDIERLLAWGESGDAALFTSADATETILTPEHTSLFLDTTARH